jgi:hypothetical protein
VYLSAFTYGRDFREQLAATRSTRGFGGPCWAPFVWWDFDAKGDLERARLGAARLTAFLAERYRLDDELLAFFSGSKGFHVGLPTGLWRPEPSPLFNLTARAFARRLVGPSRGNSAGAGCPIDEGIYDKVRPFRAPNSAHPKTGLYKRRLSLDELQRLSVEGICLLAREPWPFEPRFPPGPNKQAAADWLAAQSEAKGAAQRKARPLPSGGAQRLNRMTLQFIREGAAVGDRHRLLFSAAANLAELSCPPALAHALLTEAGLDSGLPPKEVRRQIDCGLAHGRKHDGQGGREWLKRTT